MVATLALVAGCGGNTNTHGDDDGAAGSAPRGGSPDVGGAGGSSPEGGGGRAAAPMKDGVPIGDCRELTPAEKSKLWTEVLDHQIEAEKQLLRYLTPEQRETLRGRAPTILRFAPGENAWSDRRRGSPL